MKYLLATMLLTSACAHISAQQWCQSFCGDMSADAWEHSTKNQALATCVCSSKISEEFDQSVEDSMGPPSVIKGPLDAILSAPRGRNGLHP